ncbi:MAG: lipoyl synthase [Candidatus Pelagibacterales bacterium]
MSKSLIRKNFSNLESPKKPEWIKVTSFSKNLNLTASIVNDQRLTTVCEEALCPNISECWNKKHATFMILGDVCTRSCSFCNIQTGKPIDVDPFEPLRVAKAVKSLNLKHVVITSVDRDDLHDGGANHFVKTISKIRDLNNEVSIEILTPDFKNKINAISKIIKCNVDVFNHNLETVKRLYSEVRPGADYNNSLNLLNTFKLNSLNTFTKSGIMIGLGENEDEIVSLMDDLIENGVDFLTIGQYLRPSKKHYPVIEYHHPDYFDHLKEIAIHKGFKIVSSTPFTRSSYHADDDFKALKNIN